MGRHGDEATTTTSSDFVCHTVFTDGAIWWTLCCTTTKLSDWVIWTTATVTINGTTRHGSYRRPALQLID